MRSQRAFSDFYVTIRTSRSQSEKATLSSFVRAVHELSPELLVNEEETMADRINNSQSAYLHRSAASIVAGFAILALSLGVVGLYGVISYSVAQRTREIGVRMALGAQRSSVHWLILSEAAWLAISAITGGIAASVWLATLLRSMLFGVSPWDMNTLLSVACILFASALVASYIPARRASSINPVEALRAE